MSSAIELWLKQRLGICLNLLNPNVGEKLYNGVIYCKLLKSYNIINDKNVQEPKMNVSEECAFMNLLKLCPWFQLLGIKHDRRFFRSVAMKERFFCVRLLYELYLKLEGKDNNIGVISQEKETTSRPTIDEMSEITEDETFFLPSAATDDIHFETDYFKNNDLIKKYEDYKKKIQQECKEDSRIRREKLHEVSQTEQKYLLKHRLKDMGVKEETASQDNIKKFIEQLATQNKDAYEFFNCPPSEHINRLKQQKRKTVANEVLKLKMQNMLLHDLWSTLLAKQEQEFNSLFKDKLKHQSEYEKKLATKLAKIHNNFKSLFEEKPIPQKKSESETSIVKDEVLQKKGEKIALKNENILELHRKLYEEKIKQKQLSHLAFCKDIVNDLVDIAILASEEEQTTNKPVTRKIMNDWKELFYKGKPFFISEPSSVKEVSEEISETFSLQIGGEDVACEEIKLTDTLMLRNREIIDSLNKFHVHSYLYLVGQWNIDYWPELGDGTENLEITGFDVHRLLEQKYPYPEKPKPEHVLENFIIRALVVPSVRENAFITSLALLLSKPKIAVVQLNTALNYCLEMFATETNLSDFGKSFKIENNTVKVVRKSVPKGSRKSSSEDTTPKQKAGKHKSKTKITLENKATQFPSVDDIYHTIKHSTAANLGKYAFEISHRGDPLPDDLLCKIMVEYLKTLKDYNGIVLINFPTNSSQAVMLEFLITGNLLNVNFQLNQNVEKYINNVAHPPITVDVRTLQNFEGLIRDLVNETAWEVVGEAKEKKLEKSEDSLVLEENKEESLSVIHSIEEIPVVRDSGSQEIQTGTISAKKVKKEKSEKKQKASTDRESVKSRKSSRSLLKSKKTSKSSKSGKSIGHEKSERAERLSAYYFPPITTTPLWLLDKPQESNIYKQPISLQEFKNLHTSNILPRPNPPYTINSTDKSYFSLFLTSSTTQERYKKEDSKGKKEEQSEMANEVEELEITPMMLYKQLNILKFTEPATDIHSVKRLARTILGEDPKAYDDPERKSSAELFGQDILEQVVKLRLKRGSRASRGSIGSMGSRGRLSKAGRKSVRRQSQRKSMRRQSQKKSMRRQSQRKSVRKTSLRRKSTSENSVNRRSSSVKKKSKRSTLISTTSRVRKGTIEEEEEEEEETEIPPKTPSVDFPTKVNPPAFPIPPEPTPGSSNWIYMEEPISQEQVMPLASIWEIIEHVYLANLYQIMHLLRVQNAKLLPYVNFIRNIIDEYIELPDDRSSVVAHFQMMFNDVLDEYRKDPEMKAELHCRVFELYMVLCEIADKKKNVSLNKKQEIVDQEWLDSFIEPLLSIFICLMQIELDRFIDTIQLLCDYYMSMMEHPPDPVRLEKTTLRKSKKSDDNFDSLFSLNNQMFCKTNEMKTCNTKGKKENHKFYKEENHINLSLNSIIQSAIEKIKHARSYANHLIQDEKVGNEYRIKLHNAEKKKLKTPSEKYMKEDKSDKPTSRLQSRSSQPTLPDVQAKGKDKCKDMDLIDKLKWEWQVAIENEIHRLIFRLKLIERKTKDDIEEAIMIVRKTIKDFELDVGSSYHREIIAIEELCKTLRTAIEEETPIQPLFALDKDKFYRDQDNKFYPTIPPPPPTPIEEIKSEYTFTEEQLNNFVTKMTSVSPSGITDRTFLDILEDMALFTTEDYQPYLPRTWAKLNRNDLFYILEQAFGDLSIMDWRDFVLFVSNIPLPTINELVDLKNIYRNLDSDLLETITYEEFMSIPLWFEENNANPKDKNLKSYSLKKILFKMFQVSKKEINYSAFLLMFCKGEDSLEGFMKALTLLDDKNILIDAEEYLENIMKKMNAEKIVDQIIVKILNDALQISEGITIKTLPRQYIDEDIHESEYSLINEQMPFVLETEQSEELSEIYSSTNFSDVTIGIHPEYKPLPTYPERYNHPKWSVCISYNRLLTLLIVVLNFYALSPDYLYRQLDLEERLMELFQTKGKNGYIKGYHLAESTILKELFESTGVFKYCNLTNFVHKNYESKISQ